MIRPTRPELSRGRQRAGRRPHDRMVGGPGDVGEGTASAPSPGVVAGLGAGGEGITKLVASVGREHDPCHRGTPAGSPTQMSPNRSRRQARRPGRGDSARGSPSSQRVSRFRGCAAAISMNRSRQRSTSTRPSSSGRTAAKRTCSLGKRSTPVGVGRRVVAGGRVERGHRSGIDPDRLSATRSR